MTKNDEWLNPPARSWQETFLKRCGPGILAGIALEDWLRLLRDKELAIDAARWPRATSISVQSFKNSILRSVEKRRFGALIDKTRILPPLFVLGHWRSGTTHLHNLLTQDSRFGFPNSYHTSFPHTFLTAEATDSRMLSVFIPKGRPMDEMELTLASPQEDEFALCASTLLSPCMGWVFPRHKERFEKYLTFQEVEPGERERWCAAFRLFLKKVQLRAGDRQLVLKSPPHTARIRLLLELFPDAKFVHIRRNPYRVFQSSYRTFRIIMNWHGLQRPHFDGLEDYTLRQYQRMYQAFFAEKKLVPDGNFHELSLEQLEKDPVGEIGKMYEALGLPDFRSAERGLRKYAESRANYKKNSPPELEPALKSRIGKAWETCFDAWKYPMN